MFKNVIGIVVFAAFINYFGFTYLFADIEPGIVIEPIVIELPVVESLYDPAPLTVDDPEVHCMAANIYHEARNQGEEGMYAVAFVTMNRVNHVRYPNSICEVVHQPHQFSWTLFDVYIDKNNTAERRAWSESRRVALSVMRDEVENALYGVTHYHANYVNPIWNRSKMEVAVIGDHIFYSYH